MATGRRMEVAPIRELAFGGIGVAYADIGTALSRQVRIIHLSNLTDATLMFSFDGSADHIVLPSQGFLLLDITANKINDAGFFIAENTQISVRQLGIPTTGSVYISAFFAA